MKKVGNRINLFLITVIMVLLSFVLFIDAERLNSLLIHYDDSFVVDEVSILNVDSSAVVQQAENVVPVNNDSNKIVNTNSTPTVMNKVASTDYWAWPTESNYVITSTFGYRWGSMHDAIDISGPGYGSNIYAANNGVVTIVKGGCVAGNTSCNGKGGNYIVINHNINNYYTVYMHLKDIKVSVGQVITRGQVIGTMGNTGNVVPVPTANAPYLGTHLHFGLYIGQPYSGGYAVNPMRLY